MNTHSLYSRIARRETHSPRSGLAIIIAIILILAASYAVIEMILTVVGQPPLLVTPRNAARAVVSIGTLPVAILIGAGIVLAVVGALLIINALTAGRRAKHLIQSDRAVTIIDNEVIASALARHASYAGNTDPDNTNVSVSHNRAIVQVTPSSGQGTDTDSIRQAVDEQLDSYDVTPKLRSKVIVRSTGKVGA